MATHLTPLQLSERKGRAREGYTSGQYRVRHTGCDLFLVTFQPEPERCYVVDERMQDCSCDDFQYRGGPCKHLFMVGFYLEETEQFWADLAAELEAIFEADEAA